MSSAIVIVGVIGLVLMFWNAVNWFGFESGYRYHGQFQGKRYECSLRFANADHSCPCFIGADAGALYLLAHPNRKGWWWQYGGVGYKKNLQIPWNDLEFRETTVLLKACMLFEVSGKKIYFFVPKDIADKVLVDAERKIPVSLS